MKNWFNLQKLDLQARVILILIVVILPTSFLLTLAQSRIIAPVLHDEMKQVGLSFAQNLANQIESNRILSRPNATALLEDRIQRMLYLQPNVLRVDVYVNNPVDERIVVIASNVEDAEKSLLPMLALVNQLSVRMEKEDDIPVWDILYPIKSGNITKANIHILISLKLISSIQGAILNVNFIGAVISTVLLILMLSVFLRRVIDNEKQLKVAQISNEVLSEKLQEIQQELIHKERLAVMGQLTASFAHEIGTPLNAIGGHMQLLNMDLEKSVSPEILKPAHDRMEIIIGQLKKIESIVKGFLKTNKTSLPESRIQTSARELIERVLRLVQPTLQRYQINVESEFTAQNDQIAVVPIEIEQVILNLINNAVDSMKEQNSSKAIWIRTMNEQTNKYLNIEIEDTGSGISAENLKRVFKPFFTTKSTGEGHGLGLSICQDIIRSYGGEITVESKLNSGTTLKVQLPLKGMSV